MRHPAPALTTLAAGFIIFLPSYASRPLAFAAGLVVFALAAALIIRAYPPQSAPS